MNEGLAEHTRFALAIPNLEERVPPLVLRLAAVEADENFGRSFAYTTGPAWGALIDARDRRWTREVKPSDDLVRIARRAWRLQAPTDAARRAAAYGEEVVRADEAERTRRKVAERAALRAKFVEGPVLVIPLREMQFTFDPSDIRPLDDLGSIYRTMELRDRWGSIKVTGGALLTSDYRRLIVPVGGEGYALSLADGWKIQPGPRGGDEVVASAK